MDSCALAQAASRPWDLNRDGFVMGEGAGCVVLESLESAQKRGATILAEFLGGSYTCDAHHMTEPRPDGLGVQVGETNPCRNTETPRNAEKRRETPRPETANQRGRAHVWSPRSGSARAYAIA